MHPQALPDYQLLSGSLPQEVHTATLEEVDFNTEVTEMNKMGSSLRLKSLSPHLKLATVTAAAFHPQAQLSVEVAVVGLSQATKQ